MVTLVTSSVQLQSNTALPTLSHRYASPLAKSETRGFPNPHANCGKPHSARDSGGDAPAAAC